MGSDDSEEDTTSTSMEEEQGVRKRARAVRGALLKEIGQLRSALLARVNNLIAMVDKLEQSLCEKLDV